MVCAGRAEGKLISRDCCTWKYMWLWGTQHSTCVCVRLLQVVQIATIRSSKWMHHGVSRSGRYEHLHCCSCLNVCSCAAVLLPYARPVGCGSVLPERTASVLNKLFSLAGRLAGGSATRFWEILCNIALWWCKFSAAVICRRPALSSNEQVGTAVLLDPAP
jgi:hypothetical protein